MGASYTNVSVQAPLATLAVDGLARAAEQDGWTVLLAEDVEGLQAATDWAQELTAESDAVALAVDLHDSDVLQVSLVVGGEVRGSYDSYPNYFSDDEDRAAPTGLPAEDLVAVLGGNTEQAEEVLRFCAAVDDGEDPYLFEEARHADLLAALGLPALAVGAGWRDAPAEFALVTS